MIEEGEKMKRFPVLTHMLPEKKKFLDKQRTMYLKAEHKEKPVTLYWIEQTSIVGRKAYPCVYAEGDEVLSFLHTNKEASVPLETKWAALTPELIETEFHVTSLEEKQFFEEYHNYRGEHIKQMAEQE